jgi:hypothetical protein
MLRQPDCIFRLGILCSACFTMSQGARSVSRLSFVRMIATALLLTAYFGVAAWRASDDREMDITGSVSSGATRR